MRFWVFLLITLGIYAQKSIDSTSNEIEEDIKYSCTLLLDAFIRTIESEINNSPGNQKEKKKKFKECCVLTLTHFESQSILDPDQIPNVLKSIGCGTDHVRSKESTNELLKKQKIIKSPDEDVKDSIKSTPQQNSQNSISGDDEKKAIQIGCFILSHSLIEPETSEIEKLSIELKTKPSSTSFKITCEFTEFCLSTLKFNEATKIIEDSKETENMLKQMNYKIDYKKLRKNGVELTNRQKEIREEIRKITKDFEIITREMMKNVDQKPKENIPAEKDKSGFGFWEVLTGVSLTAAAFFTLPIMAGFGAAGIVGGSLAALFQATVGNVAAGSIFAVLTSLGMKGILLKGAYVSCAAAATGFAKMFHDQDN
jgi:hypothetical protein